jgi:hypothetical protein
MKSYLKAVENLQEVDLNEKGIRIIEGLPRAVTDSMVYYALLQKNELLEMEIKRNSIRRLRRGGLFVELPPDEIHLVSEEMLLSLCVTANSPVDDGQIRIMRPRSIESGLDRACILVGVPVDLTDEYLLRNLRPRPASLERFVKGGKSLPIVKAFWQSASFMKQVLKGGGVCIGEMIVRAEKCKVREQVFCNACKKPWCFDAQCKDFRCGICNSAEHVTRTCKEKLIAPADMLCSTCKESGHCALKCPAATRIRKLGPRQCRRTLLTQGTFKDVLLAKTTPTPRPRAPEAGPAIARAPTSRGAEQSRKAFSAAPVVDYAALVGAIVGALAPLLGVPDAAARDAVSAALAGIRAMSSSAQGFPAGAGYPNFPQDEAHDTPRTQQDVPEPFRQVVRRSKRPKNVAPGAEDENPQGESNSLRSEAVLAAVDGFVQDPSDPKMLVCVDCSRIVGRQGAMSHRGSERCRKVASGSRTTAKQQTISGMLNPARSTN